MKFIVDAQLPPKLSDWLNDRGHDSIHVASCDLGNAPDQMIADLAEAEQRTLVSKDEDFLRLRLPDRFSFVWIRIGNASNRVLIARLEEGWPAVETMLARGDRLIELR
ncbi:DUF5615 family PIN-like protein [Sphingomonas sp. KR1UV-12]|uniref:DUF5615 family PIN-like protein n=1 Tax=Sphingomonas aurea TaxID=3063994 RepID=A0ABT9EKB3_9SPHN|nr:DUF5615 family PIN-like protein [Sphingomonas sp. KR1UV-12]MDP1027386.1 DUF5615 family PIN-like protein [Sphingomonas sp. KR1UV-12]